MNDRVLTRWWHSLFELVLVPPKSTASEYRISQVRSMANIHADSQAIKHGPDQPWLTHHNPKAGCGTAALWIGLGTYLTRSLLAAYHGVREKLMRYESTNTGEPSLCYFILLSLNGSSWVGNWDQQGRSTGQKFMRIFVRMLTTRGQAHSSSSRTCYKDAYAVSKPECTFPKPKQKWISRSFCDQCSSP